MEAHVSSQTSLPISSRSSIIILPSKGGTSPKQAPFQNLEHASYFARNSFENHHRFPVFPPSDPSQDPAQNRETRPLSMPDRKFSQEKGGGYSAEHLATQGWVRETSDPTNRPL